MPPWLIPALIASANLASKFFEKKPKTQKFEAFTPQQTQLQNQLASLLGGEGQGGVLDRLFGQEGFEEFAAPYKRMFEEQIVPGLAEKFSGGFGAPGAASAQGSSGFQQQLARSGEDLMSSLAQIRGQQQFGALPELLQGAMKPSFGTGYTAGRRGPLADFLSPINQAYGNYLGQRGFADLFKGQQQQQQQQQQR